MKRLALLLCLLLAGCGGANEAATNASNDAPAANDAAGLQWRPYVKEPEPELTVAVNEAAKGDVVIKLPVVKVWWDDFFDDLAFNFYEAEPEPYPDDYRERFPGGTVIVGLELLDRKAGIALANIKSVRINLHIDRGSFSSGGKPEKVIVSVSGGANVGEKVQLSLKYAEQPFRDDTVYQLNIDHSAAVIANAR